MRLAREWKVPHSTIAKWSTQDVTTALAYLAHLDDMGPCGFPHSKTTQPGFGDDFRVDGDTVCEICTKLEDFRNHEHPKPGAVVRVVNVWDDE